MIKLNRCFLLVTAMLLWCAGGGNLHLQAQDKENPLDQLRERFQEGQIFYASFEHIYYDDYTGDTEKSEGEVWVGNNEYKVKADFQRVLVFEGVSRVYDTNRNRVVVSKYDPQEDDFAPSKFLTGADTLYKVVRQETETDTVRITMHSEDPFTVFKEIEIRLDTSLQPLSINAVDQADNRVITRFRSGYFLDDGKEVFELNYPEDAEIIDLRK
jgi:hypothetical protein